MVPRKDCLMLWTLIFYFSLAAAFFIHCDARSPRRLNVYQQHQNPTNKKTSSFKNPKITKPLKHFNIYPNLLADTIKPSLLEAESPYSMPPLGETMGPLSPSYVPLNEPPFCIYPPFTPLPPSVTIPSPVAYATPPPPPSSTTPTYPIESPPPPAFNPNPPSYPPGPPGFNPNPPSYPPGPPGFNPTPPEYGISPPIFVPNPPEYVPSPTIYIPSPPEYVPSPPEFVPGPPEFGPSPPASVPGPPVFLPPVVYPSPLAPPPGRSGTGLTLWCVAKPSVPEPIIQEAMNYACGSGADCGTIQPSGSCYEPNTLLAHASYAFNSYWQRTKSNGGTCDFGGTAILVTKDPSYDGCHFTLS